jgi:CDP-diacylglycerol--serine O-phosphatidyltransferase
MRVEGQTDTMPDVPHALRGLKRQVTARNGWGRSDDRTNVLRALTGADYLSLAALLVAWVAALLCLSGEPNLAILTMFGAFGFDKLDGWWARRQGTASKFGRQIDSFIDIFAYLVTGALLFHYELAPNEVVSAVVGFVILAFGGLRLVRHNAEGFDAREGTSYYHGTTVVHTNGVVLVNYALVETVAWWNGWLAAASVLVAAPLMISAYRAPKTVRAHVVLGVAMAAIGAVCLGLEFGSL